MEQIKKVLITKHGRKFYAKDLDKDLHTQFGYVKSADLRKAKDGSVVKSNTNYEFLIMTPSFIDIFRKIRRCPQIIPTKDVGLIIAETGINNKSRVLDAGTGSGALACMLANVAKEVFSYEVREDFFRIAEENLEFLGLKNVRLRNRDVYESISEKNIDLVVLDLPEPWKAVSHAEDALKVGGFLVNYSPTIPQVMDFRQSLDKKGLIHLKTVEVSEREWELEGRKVRPRSKEIGHSGFLTFCRKIRH
ncbi:methyltransferase domain-containing protein [Candidatus Woesearchaeota archaeon]|nr:methyltransferase domain-containing protein [Candidatus Woesearchaeota archaeon]